MPVSLIYFFRFKAKKIPYFSLSFALSEYERRTLLPGRPARSGAISSVARKSRGRHRCNDDLFPRLLAAQHLFIAGSIAVVALLWLFAGTFAAQFADIVGRGESRVFAGALGLFAAVQSALFAGRVGGLFAGGGGGGGSLAFMEGRRRNFFRRGRLR